MQQNARAVQMPSGGHAVWWSCTAVLVQCKDEDFSVCQHGFAHGAGVICSFAHKQDAFTVLCQWPGASSVTTFTDCMLECRLSCLEEMSGMEVLASDKTGTLTLNK